MTKSLKKVNARSLLKAFGNKPYFVMINITICLKFNTKHPFVLNDMKIRGIRNQIPSLVSKQA